ncbi:Benzoate transport protein [Wickerhamomyces ciferrii]|uniref:Benzoate transport protein n=1 Tax=Wickerhamomyces ciferrii (strain ATCC 14091 / BCRC 22168 / CBS 111 / JCM 3599 / NBRC 0793 / NRRL Y-1031 F-60-10) TaxID=1206466 RepID=K0KSK8_WICCF|nr:Benzoate transport protein [Wickerhamomyces ciferrii]CCH46146.1 Benzoate transport protein [Wickerhamomyces ciferrii]
MVSIGEHIGLYTVLNAPRDIHIILIARCTRLAAFGAISLILVQFLKTKGINETQIGFLLTLTLVGDLFFSFILALISDTLGRRKVLLLSSILISLTGALLLYFENLLIISVILILGIVTPSGNEVGPFRSIEQSAISSLTKYEHRSDIFSWYTFTGGIAAGLGSFIVGKLVNENNYNACFLFYSIIGLLLVGLNFLLSEHIELKNDISLKEARDNESSSESEPLIPETASDELQVQYNNTDVQQERQRSVFSRLLPSVSTKSLETVLTLTVLISLDSLGLALSTKSWTSYYFKVKYNLSSSTLGLVFGTASIGGALMALVGTYFCKKFGPIKTMVSFHSVSSILLSAMSLPLRLHEMVTLFIIRGLIRTVDLPSKHVFISAVVEPSERTAAIGFINATKTLVNTMGPTISGYMASQDKMWLCFLIAGALRLSYDFGLIVKFWNFKA